MKKLAVLIMTYNEEKNLAACLETVQFADEIVVADSGSTDKTVEIAQSYGAKVVVRPMDEGGFAAQRNFLLENTEADWVFYIDADERLLPEAADEIKAVINRNEEAVWSIRRYNVVMGQQMKYGVNRPDWSDRFGPRRKIQWVGAVHEGIVSELGRKKLRGMMMHYTYVNWEIYLRKMNQYTSLGAQSLFEKRKNGGVLTGVGHASFGFIKSYLLKLGFLDGWMGFTMCFMASCFIMVKYLKLQTLYRIGLENAVRESRGSI